MLGKLSGAALARRAVVDETIDPMVLGVESAYYVAAARRYRELGDREQEALYSDKAVEKEDTRSCPGSGKASAPDKPADTNEPAEKTKKTKEAEDCEFVSKECPKCHKKNVKTVVSKGIIRGECGCKEVIK